MTDGSLDINWGYAESMAYASLLKEGYPIRITGQDVRRGTFSIDTHVSLIKTLEKVLFRYLK
jgi:2-oxoglutarate dehydrogenase complex dehydrogenase (E1) component-like enzyme